MSDIAVEQSYLDKLEQRAEPLNDKWLAFDPETPGYECLEVVHQLRYRRDRDEPFAFALRMERSRLENARRRELANEEQHFEQRKKLANALAGIPDDLLTEEEEDWRCRMVARQLRTMGNGKWYPSETKKARALVAKAEDVKRAREIAGGSA